MREKTIRCESDKCGRRGGGLIQCKGTCRRFYHALCLQIDCLDAVGWDTKKEHFCLGCRDADGKPDLKGGAPAVRVDDSTKGNARQVEPSAKAPGKSKNASATEVDQYFGGKAGKKSEATRSDIAMPSQEECAAVAERLHRLTGDDRLFDGFEEQYRQQFREWSFSLATRQSILLYGLGSKISVLSTFGQYLAQEGDVMSLNGFDPGLDMSKLLDYLERIFCAVGDSQQSISRTSGSAKALAKRAASIAKSLAVSRSRPLFLVIHNIDGAGLRCAFAQEALATLTASSANDGTPLIRVVASVDDVNAAMVLWSPQLEHMFDWVSDITDFDAEATFSRLTLSGRGTEWIVVEEGAHIPTIFDGGEEYASGRIVQKDQETEMGTRCRWRVGDAKGADLCRTKAHGGVTCSCGSATSKLFSPGAVQHSQRRMPEEDGYICGFRFAQYPKGTYRP